MQDWYDHVPKTGSRLGFKVGLANSITLLGQLGFVCVAFKALNFKP